MRWPSVPRAPGSKPLTTLLICSSHLHVQVALRVYCPVKSGGNLQSIGSVVSDAIVRSCFGRLQLGVPHWATSVALLQVVDD